MASLNLIYLGSLGTAEQEGEQLFPWPGGGLAGVRSSDRGRGLNQNRRNLGGVLGINSSLGEVEMGFWEGILSCEAGTEFPEKLWLPHPWRWPGATWDRGR